ncbi:phosphoglycerate mutase [Pilimelia terevasa]|uniref:Phosphoglycerate mutase n=1 Tax=Pilimelia terevasa TaxID=53372 RepID=A0A8J3BQD5_9ACTN|nr:histidine phosphatase family protein [Pilimelia terevasa]GGK40363.1 phosphoglycerate mutase [Pilimelia terevasa]
MARTVLYLVRHGEPAPSGADPGLSARGQRQARQLGRRLRGVPFAAVHHGPSARTRETADALLREAPELAAHACPLAADRTPWPFPAEAADLTPAHRRFLAGVPERERDEGAAGLRAAVDRLGRVDAADRYELVVTHNFVIGWFVRHVLDAPDWRWFGLDQAHAALTVVAWRDAAPPTLVAFNDTGHLGDGGGPGY